MQKLHKGREESEGEMVERREGDQKRADEVEVEKGVDAGPGVGYTSRRRNIP
jgi:hypothetical protein